MTMIIEGRILRWFIANQGIDNRVSRLALEALTGADDRKNREAIAELRHGGIPIAEISGEPGGYYMATSVDELEPTIHRYDSRLKESRAGNEFFGGATGN
jgi:hypothetical protein